jgi:hypothetical protein
VIDVTPVHWLLRQPVADASAHRPLILNGDAGDYVWLSFEQGDAMASINVGDENSSPIEIQYEDVERSRSMPSHCRTQRVRPGRDSWPLADAYTARRRHPRAAGVDDPSAAPERRRLMHLRSLSLAGR